MIKELDIESIIEDYAKNGMGIYPVCEKYHIGKKRLKKILSDYGIPIKTVGGQEYDKKEFVVADEHIEKYVEHKGMHYEVYDANNPKFRVMDYKNKSGCLTSYIEKQYGVKIPSLYMRNMYYKRTGNYWWEQWLTVEEKKVEEVVIKKCPYCDWTTKDVSNRSGAYWLHIKNAHNLSKKEYLTEHPEDKEYFKLVNPTLNLEFEEDENKYIECKICGRKLKRISSEHLKKHGISTGEYMTLYGLTGNTCNETHISLSKSAINTNMHIEKSFSSSQENEIKDFISRFGIECRHDRKILKGKELDILIPSKNIAIEFNGNMWHSEKFGKDRRYHLDKLEQCNENGIGLLQIFEDEFAEHKDIVFSKIQHILGVENLDSKRIPGRKCVVSELNKSTANDFLERNHIQGFVNSTKYIGAYYDNELIAVMTFTNESMGYWNLTRFASKNGYICQGVGGKLFKYFVNQYNPIEVKSFADRRWTVNTSNNLYTNLGFKLDGVLAPEYRYYNSKIDKHKRFHKFGFRKQILHKKYGLPLTMTEKEMTEKLGYVRIWDCGLLKYVWKNENHVENTIIDDQAFVD